MSVETTAPAVAKTAIKAKDLVDASHSVLPTVVETAELAIDVPSKVILKQPMIVIASLVAGGLVTAGVVYGISKLRNRKKKAEVIVVEEVVEEKAPYTPSQSTKKNNA